MQQINSYDFTGKKALIRVDFNVPLNDKFEITDDTRIRAAIPTIKKVLETGSAILMSHRGRPKGERSEELSLKHITKHLSDLLGVKVLLANDCVGEDAKTKASNLKNGEVLVLENLRFYKEEKKGDENFAKELASLADVYINDAFGTAHRAHASTTIVAKFFPNDKMFGYIIESEIKSIDKVVKDVQRPLTAILGGSKVSSKITIIENLLNVVDNLIIGGGMAYTFIKANGGKIGNSLVEEDKLDLVQNIYDIAEKNNVKLFLPVDTIIADAFDNNANTKECNINEIPDGWQGLDIGEKTTQNFINVINNSTTILWNGPVGVFEMSSFEKGTKKIAEAIADATAKGTFSLIGGGDSVAAISKYNLTDKVSYVSTGGGALLEYMEGKELPGIKAILEN